MKSFIQNRDNLKLCVVIEGPQTAGKLAFVMHGLGGNKEGVQIRAMITAFLELGYTTVSFDTTNTHGESAGHYKDATLTNYHADLEDVIDWAAQQDWYGEPFILAGHSLGAISCALFAEAHPEKVKALAPISTVVSGKLSFEAHQKRGHDELEAWRQGGISENGLKWSYMEDRLKYDLLPKAGKLTMPVLLVVGENDNRTPPEQQKILFDSLPGPKELNVIKGAKHSFFHEEHWRELHQIVKDWAAGL